MPFTVLRLISDAASEAILCSRLEPAYFAFCIASTSAFISSHSLPTAPSLCHEYRCLMDSINVLDSPGAIFASSSLPASVEKSSPPLVNFVPAGMPAETASAFTKSVAGAP